MGHVSQPTVRFALRTASIVLGSLVALTGLGGPVAAAGPADLVKDINVAAAGSGATPVAATGDSLYVSACRGDGQRAVYAIDGIGDTPRVLTEIGSCDGSAVWWAVDVGDLVFFTLSPGWSDLWVTDGTPDGTATLAHLWIEDPGVELDGILYLSAREDGRGGQELWRSDGTADGTYRVKDIRGGSNGSFPRDLTRVGERLYFSAVTGSAGRELWRSDGTQAGTVMVRDINVSGDASPTELTNVDSTLYFAANDGSSGRELWTSDGSSGGTKRVRNIRPGSASSSPQELTAYAGLLAFSANDGSHGRELWVSDGTSSGTTMVRDIRSGASSSPRDLVQVGSRLLFSADMGGGDRDL